MTVRPDDRSNNRAKGSETESVAALYLATKGYTVLERNYRRKTGEIDLVARDPDGTVAFIEVKYRKKTKAGFPEEAVTAAKQMRIRRTAEYYILEHGGTFGKRYRFDVISILGEEITHIQNAFGGF